MSHADAAQNARRPKRGDRFLHARFLDPDAPVADRVPGEFVVTATRKFGPGELDITVYHCPVKLWDAGNRRGRWYFELAKADESVLRWLPAGHNVHMTEPGDQQQAHKMAGVPATTTVETATVGTVPCCAECAAFYERMGGGRS